MSAQSLVVHLLLSFWGDGGRTLGVFFSAGTLEELSFRVGLCWDLPVIVLWSESTSAERVQVGVRFWVAVVSQYLSAPQTSTS